MKNTFKKLSKMLLIATMAGLMTSCSFMSNISSNFIDIEVMYKNEDIGEIYYNPINLSHIVGISDGIQYIDNEILVVSQPNIPKFEIELLAEKYGGEVVGYIEKTGDYQILLKTVHTFDDINALINDITNEDIIISACLNYVTKESEQNYHIIYGENWSNDLNNDGIYEDDLSWGIEAINAPAAWTLMEQNSNIIAMPVNVGLIDSGFDTDHEDLGFANDSPCLRNNIEAKHGTHVAGTMAAIGQNDIGICGVYPYGQNRLYGVSYLSQISDTSEDDETNKQAKSLNNETYFNSVMTQKVSYSELILRNVRVINQSAGFNWYMNNEDYAKNNMRNFTDYKGLQAWWDDPNNQLWRELEKISDELADFLNRLLMQGYEFVIVAAAGNDSNSNIGHLEAKYASWNNLISKEKFPDVYNRIIVVGSIGKNYDVSWFSNQGIRTDVFAPGEDIYSTIPENMYEDKVDGTSMAAPHVAGVAAMVWTASLSLSGSDVKQIILDTSSERNGIRIVNAEAAVRNAFIRNDRSIMEIQNYGSIQGYVLDSETGKGIQNARVMAKIANLYTDLIAYTDDRGHFELLLSEGSYNIIINADGYEAYSYQEDIQCTAQQVNYIDWAKLVKIESPSDSFEPDGEYIKVDFDNDGKNEIFAIEDISTYKHKLLYYDDDLSKTQLEEIDDSAFCKLKVIASEYGNHVYLNKIQNENCPIDNIYFSIYINKNNKPYCCNSGRGPLEYTDSNELIWHYGGHNENGVLVGIDYKLEYNVSKNEYDYFNANAIIVTQSDLDNMAQEIYDLSYTVFKDLSKSDQSTFYLGAVRLGSILKYGGYSINDFKSDFLKKYALEDWVHIDIKFNFYKDNSDVYVYIEYASIGFDDNINYINENAGAKGIYYNPQFNEKQAVSNNSDNLLSDYMSEEQFTQSCANAMTVYIAATATITQAYVDGKFEISHTYDNPTGTLTGTYDIPTGWIDGEGTLLTKSGKTLDLTTGLGSDFKGYMYVHIDEFYAVTCAVWSSKPIPQECKSLLIKNGEYEGLTKEEALKYGVGCYPMPY